MSYNLDIVQDKDGAIAVLFDASLWLESVGKVHSKWWKSENMNPKFFADYAEDNEFYCGLVHGVPAAAMILQENERNQSWEHIDRGKKEKALYAHWLAVARKFSGLGLSKLMIDFASKKGKEKGLKYLRLDTNAKEEKLVHLYKKLGFEMMGIDEESTAYFQKKLK